MTEDASYTQRLQRLSGATWKNRLGAQAPYRWNLRRLQPGRMLDVGCGIGRNLAHIDGNGVGVDHNEASVTEARKAGFTAFTGSDFETSQYAVPGAFDSMLVAHVLEHVDAELADSLLADYLRYVRPGGMVIVITPQEKGFTTDETHIRFVDAAVSEAHLRKAGVTIERSYSFPFFRAFGKWFPYNEFGVVGRVPR